MKQWLNWRELERMNAWGVRKKDDEEAESWNKGADGWERRSQNEGNAGERQVALMTHIDASDTVLDVGCGTGPLTIPLAKRAARVYALDSSERMLEILMEKAAREGLDNIVPIRGNYYNMKAGTDYPICDVAVARHAPCQCDILQYNTVATKYCYSLWNVAPIEQDDYHSTPGALSSLPFRRYNEPNGRLYGFNVHFNILYDAGINPEVLYDTDIKEYWGASEDEILAQVFAPFGDVAKAPEMFKKRITQAIVRDGESFYYKNVHRVSILGWKPQPTEF
ncbi:MAG: methyltransferase domain-containing protein [Oscillospiraceae bacterium]|nr:methyltransferase domain-containing protein [Oscillospiraceae bacterium]